MQIYVAIKGAKTALEVEETDTIKGVKEKIAEQTGIPADKQTLAYNKEVIEDEKTLQDYNIQPGDVIECFVTEESNITLRELVSVYDGDVLFSVREAVSDGEESTEKTIISFKNGEQEALKEELLNREVDKYRAEANVVNQDVKKVCHVVLAIILKKIPTEGGQAL